MFSPEPTQTTIGSDGAKVTQPIENEPWSSKVGVKVTPALCVVQTPPAAVAITQCVASDGSTARSMMRPLVIAGPIERSSRPLQSSSRGSAFFSAAGFAGALLSAFACGAAFGSGLGAGASAAMSVEDKVAIAATAASQTSGVRLSMETTPLERVVGVTISILDRRARPRRDMGPGDGFARRIRRPAR